MSGRLAIFVVALLVTAGGCGLEDDTSPRDISEPDRPEVLVANPINPASPASATDRIYLVAPAVAEDTSRLRAVSRDVGDSAVQRLRSLFGPMSVTETSSRLTTAIPEGLLLHSATLRSDGTLVVDVGEELLDLSSSALIDAVAQIVFTASELSDVQRVDLLVDGAARQWPAADGELQAQPLTVYDFPGFVESTQPAYPAVPSP